MSWTSSRPYQKTPRGFRITDAAGRIVASGTVAGDAQLRVMAAAPDMREALKKLLADAEHVRDVALREVGIGMIDELALDSARTAIAKAEGRS